MYDCLTGTLQNRKYPVPGHHGCRVLWLSGPSCLLLVRHHAKISGSERHFVTFVTRWFPTKKETPVYEISQLFLNPCSSSRLPEFPEFLFPSPRKATFFFTFSVRKHLFPKGQSTDTLENIIFKKALWSLSCLSDDSNLCHCYHLWCSRNLTRL